MKNKKGIGKGETLIIVIVAMLIFVLLGTALNDWLSTSEKIYEKEICRDSVIINSKLSGVSVGQFQTQLQCPAETHEFKSSQKEEKAKIEIAEKIAKEMYNCWYKMGSGDTALFHGIFKNQLYCVVCSEFTTDREIETRYVKEALNNQKDITGTPFMTYIDTWWGDYNTKGDKTEEYFLPKHFFVTDNYETTINKDLKKITNKEDPTLITTRAPISVGEFKKFMPGKGYTMVYMQKYDTAVEFYKKDADFQSMIITPTESIIQQRCSVIYHEKK